MRKFISLICAVVLLVPQFGSAVESTFLGVLNKERNSGNKHISKTLTDYLVLPDGNVRSEVAQELQTRTSVDKLDIQERQLVQTNLDLENASKELAADKDNFSEVAEKINFYLIMVGPKKSDPAGFVKTYVTEPKYSKEMVGFYTAMANQIAKQENVNSEAVDRARDNLLRALSSKTRDYNGLSKALGELETQLTVVAKQTCNAAGKEVCPGSDEDSLEKFWDTQSNTFGKLISDSAKAAESLKDWFKSVSGKITGYFNQEKMAATNKIIQCLGERKIVRHAKMLADKIAKEEKSVASFKSKRNELDASVERLKQDHTSRLEKIKTNVKKWNLANQRAYTYSMEKLVALIPLTKREGAKNRTRLENGQEVTFQELKSAFVTLMHGLESFEISLVKEFGKEDPYPALDLKEWLNSEFNPLKSSARQRVDLIVNTPKGKIVSSNIRETKREVMWNYYLALHGLKDNAALYKSLARDLKDQLSNQMNFTDKATFTENFRLTNLVKYIADFQQFSTNYPILAMNVTRNLTQAVRLLGSEPRLLSTIERVYSIKEAENVARDWLLGDFDHLYTAELTKAPPSVKQLAFIDFAEKAPYIAAMLVGAGGKTAGSFWVQYFLGTGVLSSIAGSLTGMLEAKSEQLAAAKISREHEIAASMLRRAFTQFYNGESALSIAKSAGAYLALREVAKKIANRRIAAERNQLLDGGCIKDNAKAGVLAGIASSPFAFFASALTITASSTIAGPVIVMGAMIGGCAIATMAIADIAYGKRAARMNKATSDFLENFELPKVGDPKQELKLRKASIISEEQRIKIVADAEKLDEKNRSKKMLESYQATVEENLKADEEEEFKEGFAKQDVIPGKTEAILKAWKNVKAGANNTVKQEFADETLTLLPQEASRSPAEKALAQKIEHYKKNLDSAEYSNIETEIQILPYREMKDELIKQTKGK